MTGEQAACDEAFIVTSSPRSSSASPSGARHGRRAVSREDRDVHCTRTQHARRVWKTAVSHHHRRTWAGRPFLRLFIESRCQQPRRRCAGTTWLRETVARLLVIEVVCWGLLTALSPIDAPQPSPPGTSPAISTHLVCSLKLMHTYCHDCKGDAWLGQSLACECFERTRALCQSRCGRRLVLPRQRRRHCEEPQSM